MNLGKNVIVIPCHLFVYLQYIKLIHFIHPFGMFQILFYTGLCQSYFAFLDNANKGQCFYDFLLTFLKTGFDSMQEY